MKTRLQVGFAKMSMINQHNSGMFFQLAITCFVGICLPVFPLFSMLAAILGSHPVLLVSSVKSTISASVAKVTFDHDGNRIITWLLFHLFDGGQILDGI